MQPKMAAVRHSPFNAGLVPYFVAAYGITWLFHGSIRALGLTFSMGIEPATALYMMGLLGPLAGALIVSLHYGGTKAASELLRSALRWRFGVVWYLCALFLIPGMLFVAIVLLNRGIPHPSEWLTFPALLIAGQVWVVIGEEFGWRGFALPRLQARFGSLGASLVLGFLWSSWHLPMFFTPGSPQYTETFWFSYIQYVGVTIFISIIMTMLYNKTNGSVLVCMLLHASLNIAAFSIKAPPEAVPIVLVLEVLVLIASIILLPRPLFRRNSSSNLDGES
jgi:membrane protease YdiL (CAAX protease family)